MILTGTQTRAYLINSLTKNNAERGAERALFLRRTAEISAEMRVFLNSAQKIRRTEIFCRKAQNGAEREAAKAERRGRLMPVSDMIQSGF